MAASNLNLGKASGGVLNIQPTDGTTTTSIVLPASGTVTTNEYVNSNNLGNGSTTFNGFGGTGFKNHIINGGFDVWQRDTSFNMGPTGTNTYHADRFASVSTFSVGSVSITKSSITYNNIKYNSAKCTTITAYTTSGANAAYRHFCYFLEGIASSVVNKGFTLSFLFNTNVAGTYTVSFRCEGNIISTYKTRITAVSGIQKIVITVPANTITTPNLDNNLGLQIYIGGVAGSSYAGLSTTLNQWDSSSTTLYYPNEMNWAGTVGNYIEIAQVQLEEGSVATPFEQRPYGLELSLCQRYYEVLTSKEIPQANSFYSNWRYLPSIWFRVTKRVTPTVILTSASVYPNSDTSTSNYHFSLVGTECVTPVDMIARGTLYSLTLSISAEL